MKVYYNKNHCMTVLLVDNVDMQHSYTDFWRNAVPLETKDKITARYFTDYNKGAREDLYYTDKDLA